MKILQEKRLKFFCTRAVRLLSYGIVTAAVIVFLLGIMNVIFLAVGLFIYQDMEVYYISGGDVMEALTLTEDGYVLRGDMAQEFENRNQWAMLLDGEGRELWNIRKPAELPDVYSQADIARMSKWYLKGYPVHLRVWDDKTMVVGLQKDTQWKYTVEFPISWMNFLKKVWLYFIVDNFVLILIVAFLFARLFTKKRERARIEWIAAISHDIRTPLSVVVGYADTLERNGELGEEARRQAAVILHQSMVIKELIADLNLTSQLEASMQPLRKETVRPAQELRGVAADFLNDAAEGTLQIAVEIAQDAGQMTVRADRQLLVRVFRNLINNSVKHGGKSGIVKIQISLWKEKRRCHIRFQDDGVGYSQEMLRRLASRKRDAVSQDIRGLGIVKKIVLAHGGRIRFGNIPEGGSFCVMVFPAGKRGKVEKAQKKDKK